MDDSGSGQSRDSTGDAWQAPTFPAASASRSVTLAPLEGEISRRPSWTPPPKRGLVPLRPIGFGA
ncbi:MAG: hypothetical protein ABI435_08370, partial [Pseudolysinimonas sp.]